MMNIDIAATITARVGEISAGRITFPTTPAHWTADVPLATSTAPISPPIRAWEELEGRPRYQVIRFQLIAPTNPANTTAIVISPVDTIPLAIVVATLIEMNAPAKFSSAAYPTASRGGIARVEIVVATTFAVSWKPFVKSKARAVATTTIRSMSALVE